MDNVFVQATVTEYHRMNGLNNMRLEAEGSGFLEAGSPGSGCWCGAGDALLLLHRQLDSHSICPWI